MKQKTLGKQKTQSYLRLLTEYFWALFEDQKTSQRILSLKNSQPRAEGGAVMTGPNTHKEMTRLGGKKKNPKPHI